jgi:TolB-like protein/tetratricopeptide (TPR) repeat protein/tRNA A-37 threonylcarbamoyl transferase component Bud32
MAELREQLQGTLGDSYQLEQELGGGGMSRVFVAHETSLGRKVVVKVLPPEMAAAVSIDRFRREIQLAAQLQHPHIVPLLSAGETAGLPYFTMPFVRGESLRARLTHGELPISEAIRILREIASALAYAHENGVVHRDIKPENILISGGSAMVTDFGVAKAVSASSGTEAGSLTSLGVALGTPAYMAPEQATADPNTDYRADIYAFGVVAYEMLTGSTPFPGRSPQATLAAQVTEAPDTVTRRRPAVPQPLASLVMKCLEKRPADRPQTAADVMHELDALSTPSGGLTPTAALPAARSSSFPRRAAIAAAGVAALALIGFVAMRARSAPPANTASVVPAIAVLPFENRGRPEGQEFTDGMTEEITNRLTSVRGLRVIGRQSASAYASTQKTPQQIAQELGVQYILTGTVRWDKGSDGKEIVRVSPALMRTADATQVWADAYQTVLSGMFDVQSKVATEVANALDIALVPPEKEALAAKPTDNVEAYSFYLRGNDLLTRSIELRDFRLAIDALEKAVVADPKFALAYARLSQAHTELFWFNGDRSPERLQKARAAADRALALDPSLPAAHLAMGVYYYHGFLDYDNALAHLSEAEKIRPNDFEAVFYKAAIQRRQGKWKDATDNMRRSLELEPRIGLYFSDAANTFFFMRNYDEAVRLSDRATVLDPTDYQGYAIRANVAVARDGDIPAATRIRRRLFDAQPDAGIAASIVLFDPWLAMPDEKMRDAAARVVWSPDRGEKSSFYVAKMEFFLRMNDQSRGKAYADSAVTLVTKRIREVPNEAEFPMELASAQAVLGRKPEALAAMQKAVTLQPFAKDQYLGSLLYVYRAVNLMRLGESDEAINQLEQLLKVPSILSRNLLRLEPIYTPLRGNPRFQRLIQGS